METTALEPPRVSPAGREDLDRGLDRILPDMARRAEAVHLLTTQVEQGIDERLAIYNALASAVQGDDNSAEKLAAALESARITQAQIDEGSAKSPNGSYGATQKTATESFMAEHSTTEKTSRPSYAAAFVGLLFGLLAGIIATVLTVRWVFTGFLSATSFDLAVSWTIVFAFALTLSLSLLGWSLGAATTKRRDSNPDRT